MIKNLKFIAFFFILFIFVTNAVSTGLSPPQLRITNTPMGEMSKVSTLRVVNTDNEPKYIILKISCLDASRENKLRVICVDEGREVGIQRGDLIHPAKIIGIDDQNLSVEYSDGTVQTAIILYEEKDMMFNLSEYVLVDQAGFLIKKISTEEALLDKGYCPFCGSDNLIYYDIPSTDILDAISLSCPGHSLTKVDNRTYTTVDTLKPNEFADIEIYLNLSDEREYYGQHWEARIMATSTDNLSRETFLVYGVETKFLLDTPVFVEKKEEESSFSPYILGIGISSSIGAVVVLLLFFKSKKNNPKIQKDRKDTST